VKVEKVKFKRCKFGETKCTDLNLKLSSSVFEKPASLAEKKIEMGKIPGVTYQIFLIRHSASDT